VGSPQPPSIEGAGAPATLLPSNRRSESDGETFDEGNNPANDPLWRLTNPKRVPLPVWRLTRTPPADIDPDSVYLAYRYLASIERAPLPEGTEANWPELLDFVESGKLKRPGVCDELSDAITQNPKKFTDAAGDLISSLDDELAVWRRFYVRIGMEEE